jgi:hypothetical protein
MSPARQPNSSPGRKKIARQTPLSPTFQTEGVLVQPEMEKRRSPLVSDSALRAGIFKAWGSFDPMEVGRRKNESSRPVHRLDEPTGLSLGMVASPHCPLPFHPAR